MYVNVVNLLLLLRNNEQSREQRLFTKEHMATYSIYIRMNIYIFMFKLQCLSNKKFKCSRKQAKNITNIECHCSFKHLDMPTFKI